MTPGISADEAALRREHRAAQARREAENPRLNVPRLDVTDALPAGGRLAAALRQLEADPELAARLERERIAEEKATRDEVEAQRRAARFALYAATRPSMYRGASYDDFEPGNEAHAKVRGWWRSGAKTLVIVGEPGRGKTHAGYAICNEVAADDRDGKSRVPAEVRAYTANALRDLMLPRGPHEVRDEVASSRRHRALQDVRTADLLLIDDLTAAKVTDWFRESVHGILDARVTGQAKRTIVTMNAEDKKGLSDMMFDRFGAAIVSRLKDDAVFVWLDGVDRRRFSDWDPFA